MPEEAGFISRLMRHPDTWTEETWAIAVAVAIVVFGLLWSLYEVLVYVW